MNQFIMKDYYAKVETYYDSDAADFDARYLKNPVLQRIRQDFREEVKRFHFNNMLEIGYGTGLDLVHFGKTHPGVHVAGIDISRGMQAEAINKIKKEKLDKVSAHKGSVEDIKDLFPGQQFDMVYVFFGALNTVDNLQEAAGFIYNATTPGGVLVVSFVNKYYVAGMLLELLKLRFRAAFSRLRPVWGGYSPSQYLPSRCYSPKEVTAAFGNFMLLRTKGYSILHPAWYYHRLNRLLRKASPLLWEADLLMNKTALWRLGEYALFVFQKPHNI